MTAASSPNSQVQDATLLLLVRVNRLLDEAERVRVLRDRLMDAARQSTDQPFADRDHVCAEVVDASR